MNCALIPYARPLATYVPINRRRGRGICLWLWQQLCRSECQYLDVFLYSLQKYAPEAKVIVVVEKSERPYVDKLAELFDLQAILTLPVSTQQLEAAFTL